MSSVREEAESCINIAHAYIRIGNLTKAQELAEKAAKLFPSAKVKNLKKKIAKKRKADSSSEQKPQTEFTPEHLDAVNQVNNCKSLYEMLQLNKDFTDADIKKAFRRFALTLHPDNNHIPGAEEAFKAMNNAVNLLIKPVSKRIYNSFLDAVASKRFYGHDASHYPPKWWCDASEKTVEVMEFCLSSGYKCQNADCERRRKNEQESRNDEARKQSEEEARRQQNKAKEKFEEESKKRSEEERKRQQEEARRRKSEEESRKRIEEEARKQEEARRQRSEEESRKRVEEARRQQEEARRRKSEEESRKRIEEEARKQEEATQKIEEQPEEEAIPWLFTVRGKYQSKVNKQGKRFKEQSRTNSSMLTSIFSTLAKFICIPFKCCKRSGR